MNTRKKIITLIISLTSVFIVLALVMPVFAEDSETQEASEIIGSERMQTVLEMSKENGDKPLKLVRADELTDEIIQDSMDCSLFAYYDDGRVVGLEIPKSVAQAMGPEKVEGIIDDAPDGSVVRIYDYHEDEDIEASEDIEESSGAPWPSEDSRRTLYP